MVLNGRFKTTILLMILKHKGEFKGIITDTEKVEMLGPYNKSFDVVFKLNTDLGCRKSVMLFRGRKQMERLIFNKFGKHYKVFPAGHNYVCVRTDDYEFMILDLNLNQIKFNYPEGGKLLIQNSYRNIGIIIVLVNDYYNVLDLEKPGNLVFSEWVDEDTVKKYIDKKNK